MKITEALLRDHQTFNQEFQDLERDVQSGVEWSDLQAQLDALNATLDTHVQLEDELLLGALESKSGTAGLITAMREGHSELSSAFLKLFGPSDLAEAQEPLFHMLEVARLQFGKEEQVLFPKAEELLDPNALEQLGEQFANRRRIVMI